MRKKTDRRGVERQQARDAVLPLFQALEKDTKCPFTRTATGVVALWSAARACHAMAKP